MDIGLIALTLGVLVIVGAVAVSVAPKLLDAFTPQRQLPYAVPVQTYTPAMPGSEPAVAEQGHEDSQDDVPRRQALLFTVSDLDRQLESRGATLAERKAVCSVVTKYFFLDQIEATHEA